MTLMGVPTLDFHKTKNEVGSPIVDLEWKVQVFWFEVQPWEVQWD